MKILEFQTQDEANSCLAALNQIAAAYWVEQGYIVDELGLVGKCASNGEDRPEAQRTTTWDEVRESPDGTFYFYSLTGTRFDGGMAQLAGFDFVEKEFPQEWVVEEQE